MTQSVTS